MSNVTSRYLHFIELPTSEVCYSEIMQADWLTMVV